MTRSWTRWLPAVVAPVVVAAVAFSGTAFAGTAFTGAAQAVGGRELPDRSAAQVLALIADSSVAAFSATVEQSADLGLSALGDLGAMGDTSGSGGGLAGGPTSGSSPGDDGNAGSSTATALDLLTGSHTARIYLDGPARLRVQVLDQLAERDLVQRDDDVWLYDSQRNTATHLTLPAGSSGGGSANLGAPGSVRTPGEVAELLLGSLDPTTDITVSDAVVVAGRAAYEITLSPRGAHTLIGEVSIAVDGATGLPLRVRVLADGQEDAAYELAFTALTIAAPAPERFEFVPPAGATVTEAAVPSWSPADSWEPGDLRAAASGTAAGASTKGSDATDSDAAEPTRSGEGWDTVLEFPAGTASTLGATPLLGELTRAVTGGRVLETALVNVLLATDGRVLVGSVTVERLQAVAAGA